MDEIYLITGALLISAALVLSFRSSAGGAVSAYAGVWALRASGHAIVSASSLLFWAIAVLITVSIDMARGGSLLVPFRARCFIVGGALAGMAAGLAYHQAGAIVGATAGTILGAVAYMRLSHRQDLHTIGKLTVAVGLPAVVTLSLVALGIQGVILS